MMRLGRERASVAPDRTTDRAAKQAAGGGWRLLGGFWFGVLGLLIAGAATLQIEGPPTARPIAAARASLPAHADAPAASAVSAVSQSRVQAAAPALAPALAPTLAPTLAMPVGEAARPAHAAAIDHARPRIAILLSGVGLDTTQSRRAMALPAAVTLAITPYAADPPALAGAAREAGHELVLSLPLEPAGFPLNDAGAHALLTGADAARNDANLAWVLARFTGYVGATGALDGLRGERFAAATPLFTPLLRELRQRGLFYVDPRVAAAALPEGARAADLLLDEPGGRDAIQAHLAALEERARDRGTALGLVGTPTPVLLDRLENWLATLADRGFVLAPVGSLIEMPAHPAMMQQVGAHPVGARRAAAE